MPLFQMFSLSNIFNLISRYKYIYIKMSTRFMIANLNQSKKAPMRTLQHEAVLFPNGQSMRQYFTQGSFSTQTNVKPGQKTSIDMIFNSRDVELDHHWYVYFEMSTSDATNHLTLYNDCYTLIDYIELKINGGSETLKYDNNIPIRMQRSETLKENANRISQKRSESDVDCFSLAGVQVTNAAPQAFYFDVFSIFPQFKDQVINGFIKTLSVEIRFTPAATNAKDACLIGKSNTTSNAYTTSTISFNNISFLRVFDIVKDPSVVFKPALSDVVIPVARYQEKTYSAQNFNVPGSNAITLSVQDVFKEKYAQSLIPFGRDNGIAYNDVNALKEYSGHNYLKWSLKELNDDRREVNFLASSTDSTRRLRSYEIGRQKGQYGEDLPLAVHTNADDMNKYLLYMTEIPFNNIDISDQSYEAVTTLNSGLTFYSVTIEPAGAISTDCDLILVMKYFDLYKFNKNLQLEKIN